MKYRRYATSSDRQRRLERRFRDVELRLLEALEAELERIEPEALRHRVRELAFEPNDVLDKRRRRINVTVAFVAEQVYRSHVADEAPDSLLAFSAVVHEYYDLFDDLFDGDVDARHRSEVLATMQVLMPVFVDVLGDLGDEATAYWCDRAITLMQGPFGELREEPSADSYRRIVEHQSELFGFVAGVAAIAADGAADDVAAAAALGRACFVFEQYVLDLKQQRAGDDDPWNVWNLLPESEAYSATRGAKEEVASLATTLADQQAELVSALVAIDLERLVAETGTDDSP